jgi:RNA polymerase-binding protein DksA
MNSESALKARRGCSPYGEAELGGFRALLEERNARVLKMQEGLSEAGLRPRGEGSSVPVHAADLEGDVFDQGMSLDAMARARAELQNIAEALERIDNRSFGLCNDCGAAIAAARIEAMPTAEYCIDCQSRQEIPEQR